MTSIKNENFGPPLSSEMRKQKFSGIFSLRLSSIWIF